MRDWLVLATNLAVDAIDWLALVLIVVGAVEAFFQGLWTMFSSRDGHHERDVWLRLGRWLVAGLTFQLAADVLETAITTSWDEVARLAAIAAIRTFLNYFLERDLGEIQNPAAAGPERDRLIEGDEAPMSPRGFKALGARAAALTPRRPAP